MPLTRLPPWALGVVGLGAAALAVDAGIYFLTRTPSQRANGENRPSAVDSVHVIDPLAGRVVARVPVGRQPTAVAAGFGGVWVLNQQDGTVTHIDARARKVVRTIAPRDPVDGISVTSTGVWMLGHPRLEPGGRNASLFATTLDHIDPGTDKIDRQLMNRSGALVFAAGAGSLWSFGLTTKGRGDVRASPRTGEFSILAAPIYGDLVAADGDAAYFVTSLGARIQRVDARTGRLTASLSLVPLARLLAGKPTPDPTDIALGGGDVWLSQTDGTVLRVDGALRRVDRTTKACANALAIAYGEGAVWAACANGTAVRVDPRTGAASPPIRVGGLPRGIAAGEGAVWVTVD